MSHAPKIWFDIEDLYDFVERNSRPTGIQRVCYEVYRAALVEPTLKGRVGFVRHSRHERGFIEADWEMLEQRFNVITDRPPNGKAQKAQVQSLVRHPTSATGSDAETSGIQSNSKKRIVNKRLRAGFLFGVMQTQAMYALANVAGLTMRDQVRRSKSAVRRRAVGSARIVRKAWRKAAEIKIEETRNASARRLAEIVRRGDVLVVLGSPWFEVDYSELAAQARGRYGMRLAVLVHDVIPVRRPEWVDRGTVRVYRNWYSSVLPLTDLVLANSRSTAADVESWCAMDGIPLAAPVVTLPIGTGFGNEESVPSRVRSSVCVPLRRAVGQRPYVLFVSTIEARKNHMLLFRAWRRLLEEMSAGTVPDLVFVGRVGWMVDDLMNQIENSRYLDGHLHILEGLDDAGIRAAYDGCMFTVFPSYYEGWGLPVSESLSMGRPCICSNATSLPEAGGSLARYFDPFDLNDAVRVIRDAIEDKAGLADWRETVRRNFQPVSWTRTAAALAKAVGDLD